MLLCRTLDDTVASTKAVASRGSRKARFPILCNDFFVLLSQIYTHSTRSTEICGSVTIFAAPGNGRGEGVSPAIASPISLAMVVARPGHLPAGHLQLPSARSLEFRAASPQDARWTEREEWRETGRIKVFFLLNGV